MDKEETQSTGEAKVARLIQRLALFFLLGLFLLGWGFSVARYQVFPYAAIAPVIQELEAFLEGGEGEAKSLAERLTLHRQERLNDFDYGGFHLRDDSFVDPGYLVLSRYSKEHDQVIIELVKVDGFQRIKQWVPPLDAILAKSKFRDNEFNNRDGYQAQNPLLLEDGSVVFLPGIGPLACIDKDSKLKWVVNGQFHHSIERDYEGNIVVPLTHFPPMRVIVEGMLDNGWAVISPEGKMLARGALCSVLMDNGYRGLLMGVQTIVRNPLHINDAQPILEDNGLARIGDVAFSCRNNSTVLLYRPSTNKVIWLKTGPWLKQHDVNLLPNGEYSIFGNDTVEINPKDPYIEMFNEISDIYIYDAVGNRVQQPYTNILREVRMYSETEGRARVLPNGDVFIEQTQVNRLLRVSGDKLRWEYINQISDSTTGDLNWCRYLNPDEVPAIWLGGE